MFNRGHIKSSDKRERFWLKDSGKWQNFWRRFKEYFLMRKLQHHGLKSWVLLQTRILPDLLQQVTTNSLCVTPALPSHLSVLHSSDLNPPVSKSEISNWTCLMEWILSRSDNQHCNSLAKTIQWNLKLWRNIQYIDNGTLYARV